MNTVEFIKEFSSRYDKHYEFDCDSDMGIVYFSYSIDHCCALERLHLEFDEDIFSIYRDFLYEDCDSAFRVIETIKEEKVFIESLAWMLFILCTHAIGSAAFRLSVTSSAVFICASSVSIRTCACSFRSARYVQRVLERTS